MAQIQIKSSFLIDIRQTREYSLFMRKMGWQIETIAKNCQIFIKKLPFLPFSIAKILRFNYPFQSKKISEIIKKHRILFIKTYPFLIGNWKLPALGQAEARPGKIGNWRLDTSPLIPTKTIWLDLTKPESVWLKNMKSKTRYNIKLAQKKHLDIQIVNGSQIANSQLKSFYALWIKNKPHDWLFKPSFNELKYLVASFGDKCFFVFVFSSPLPTSHYTLLAGTLILCSSNMAYYWHNCSSLQGRQIFAPSLCLWQALKESKKRGLQVFDLEGIWDTRFPKLNKGWKGFSRFKSGFGGKEVEFPRPLIVK